MRVLILEHFIDILYIFVELSYTSNADNFLFIFCSKLD